VICVSVPAVVLGLRDRRPRSSYVQRQQARGEKTGRNQPTVTGWPGRVHPQGPAVSSQSLETLFFGTSPARTPPVVLGCPDVPRHRCLPCPPFFFFASLESGQVCRHDLVFVLLSQSHRALDPAERPSSPVPLRLATHSPATPSPPRGGVSPDGEDRRLVPKRP